MLKSPSLNIHHFVFWQHFININELSWSKHFSNINLSWNDLQRQIKGNEEHIEVQAHKIPHWLSRAGEKKKWTFHLLQIH